MKLPVWILVILLVLLFVYVYMMISMLIKPKGQKKIFKGHADSDDRSLPQAYAERFQAVHVTAKDGIVLNAYQNQTERFTHEWAICVHGYGGSPGDMAVYAGHFSERNMNVLLPELRGHSHSSTRYSGLSYLDGFDINVWIDHILVEDTEARILLFGLSMGGASVATACGLEEKKNVKLIITDSAPSSMYKQIKKVFRWMCRFPEFPMLHFIEWLIAALAHFHLKEASVLNYIHNIHQPWLIIHGEADGFVSPEMAKELYQAANDPKELYLAPEADHTKAVKVQPMQYWKTVDNFIETYFQEEENNG